MGNRTITASYTDAFHRTASSNWNVLVNAQAEVSLDAPGTGYGSDYVDALIPNHAGWKYGPISYSFAGVADGSIEEWTEVEKQSFRDSAQLYANVSNLTFAEGVFYASSKYSTNIKLYKYDSSQMVGGTGAGAEFYQPIYGGFGNGPIEGHFNIDYWSAPANGTYAQYATIHELGHGLGLDHPFDATPTFPGVTGHADLGANQLDTGMWTVMAYNFGWDVQGLDYSTGIAGDGGYGYGYAMTPMTFDVAAIQQLYGVNTTYKTGNDTYVIPTTLGAGEGWVCIWDAGGNDTISNAGSNAACNINLNAYPKEGGLPSAAYVSYAAGTPAGFTIADGATIENAIGGSGADVLIGNAVSNQLTGGAGADKFAFATALGVSNIDTITDFSVGQGDVLELSHTIFTALTGLTDLTLNFVGAAGAVAATTVDELLIYNTTTGALYYDQDGSASGYAAVEFALLQSRPVDVSAAQFLVI
jgi:serralysin